MLARRQLYSAALITLRADADDCRRYAAADAAADDAADELLLPPLRDAMMIIAR